MNKIEEKKEQIARRMEQFSNSKKYRRQIEIRKEHDKHAPAHKKLVGGTYGT